jgi:arylsulfatase A-like enzyme
MITYADFLDRDRVTEEEKARLRRYYGNHVEYFDGRFSQLIEMLEDFGVYEDSLIIFTSDHGEELLDRTAYLHGHSLYDEILKVPLLIRFPERRFAEKMDAMTALIDIAPSVLDYLGIPSTMSMDGINFMGVLKDRQRSHREYLLAEALAWGPERKSVRTDLYKYILTLAESDPRGLGPRTDYYNAVLELAPGEELYMLHEDPSETRNVVEEHPELAEQLRLRLEPLLNAKDQRGVFVDRDPELMDALRRLGYIR